MNKNKDKELPLNTTLITNVLIHCFKVKCIDQIPYFEPYVDPQTPFSTKFPRANNYNSEQSIIETFPQLEGVNDINFDYESISPEAQFYVLRSGNDDNIHKVSHYLF